MRKAPGDLERGADRLRGRVAGGRGEAEALDARVVARGEEAPEGSDAQRASGLARGVVHGGADAGAVARDRSHDGFGERCHGEPHPEPEQRERAGEPPVGGQYRRS